MPRTRKLTDLYVVGKEVTVDDGQGPVTVWVQKLNPFDHDLAMRKANAKRARVLAMARMPKESEERDEYMNQLFDIARNRTETINFLAAEEVSNNYKAIEAECSAEDEWSDEDYLQGLKDAWKDEYFAVYADGPDVDEDRYKEAQRISDELSRFDQQVSKEVENRMEMAKKDFEAYPEEKLIHEAVNKLIEAHAEMVWLSEFRRCELWLGVKDGKTKKPLFESRHEVDLVATEIISELVRAYAELNVDFVEGKD